jgi:hypothetical protein
MMRNLLIEKARVRTAPDLTMDKVPLAGFISVTPRTLWFDKEPIMRNSFEDIAHVAYLDWKIQLLVPVFMNEEDTGARFIGDEEETAARKPWFLFFKGRSSNHLVMRFANKEAREETLKFLGEDMGFLHHDLITHTGIGIAA